MYPSWVKPQCPWLSAPSTSLAAEKTYTLFRSARWENPPFLPTSLPGRTTSPGWNTCGEPSKYTQSQPLLCLVAAALMTSTSGGRHLLGRAYPARLMNTTVIVVVVVAAGVVVVAAGVV